MADIFNAFFAKKTKFTVSIGKPRNTAINSKISHEPYLHMEMPYKQGSIYWAGRGEASPQTSQLPPPPKKSFTEKINVQLFQIKIFFDNDFKESVKVTNVQKCDFSQS